MRQNSTVIAVLVILLCSTPDTGRRVGPFSITIQKRESRDGSLGAFSRDSDQLFSSQPLVSRGLWRRRASFYRCISFEVRLWIARRQQKLEFVSLCPRSSCRPNRVQQEGGSFVTLFRGSEQTACCVSALIQRAILACSTPLKARPRSLQIFQVCVLV